jgi:hypothetical protein
MDESAYKKTYAEVAGRPCVFEQALLGHCAACSLALHIQIAEREAATCPLAASHARCHDLHNQLRRCFSFALGVPTDGELPHAKEMRVQCGGLMGMQQLLSGDAEVADVDALITEVMAEWGDWSEVPWSEVVHEAAQNYKGRHGT